jgi:hypothetical protein
VKTRVRAHERENPHGGTEHVREHYREVPGSPSGTRNEVNFEDEDQKEEEDIEFEAEVEGKIDPDGKPKDAKVKEVNFRPKDGE